MELECHYCRISLPPNAQFCDKCGKSNDDFTINFEDGNSYKDTIQKMVNSNVPLKEARKKFERDMVEYALSKHHGNIKKAAESLGLARPSLYDLIQKYELTLDRDK